MPEPILFWLAVILFSAAAVVGVLALSAAIRLKAVQETEIQEDHRRPGTARA
jgi:hypothetical protein